MAKGANVDKLAAEFADELDSLGVRVANLEKKSDNVKITGQIRASYRSTDGTASNHQGYLRTRLFLNGQVNEDWSYTGRFENRQYYTDGDTWGGTDAEPNDDDVQLNWAYVSGPIGGVKVEAGRQDFVMGDVVDNRGDGVKLSYGDNVKVIGWAYKASSSAWTNTGNGFFDGGVEDGDRVYVAGVEGKFGVVGADLHYYKADTARENEIWELALDGEIAKDLTLRGSYFYGDSDTFNGDDSGYLVGLAYRGAKASKPGSWGLYANYSDRPLATFLEPTLFAGGYAVFPGDTAAGDGYQGYDVGANLTLAKNIVFNVKYADMESREGSTDTQTLWTDVVFTF